MKDQGIVREAAINWVRGSLSRRHSLSRGMKFHRTVGLGDGSGEINYPTSPSPHTHAHTIISRCLPLAQPGDQSVEVSIPEHRNGQKGGR